MTLITSNKRHNTTVIITDKAEIGELNNTKSPHSENKRKPDDEIKLSPIKYLGILILFMAIITGTTLLFLLLDNKGSYSSFYDEYKDKYVIRNTADIEENIKEYIINDNYELLIDKLSTSQKLNGELSIENRFYRAVCCMKMVTGNFEAEMDYAIIAQKDLKKVIQSGNKAYEEDAMWLLAMAYLSEKQIVECYQMLDSITDKSSNYEQDALMLKKKLKRRYPRELRESYEDWLLRQK